MNFAAIPLDDAINTFTTLFVVIDPIGNTPIFLALTAGATVAVRRRIAVRAVLIGFLLLTLFALAGDAVLAFVGISMPAFRVAGGLLLFLTAIDMLFEKRTERRERRAEAEAEEGAADPSVFPLATPLIAGPGSITSMILLMDGQAGNPAGQVMVMGAMALVVAVCFLLLMLSGLLEKLLRRTGVMVVTRLLGMLLAALAVQFVLDGLAGIGVVPAS